ncbi:NAD(P)-binding protein [Zopfia rhizophila CBS 207.26]|uniref:NAD(P)-binding protein n=1 Tax=Zopfia rhizophila CBS 207.26 TaxID=1314779 RepID=A0A6A6DBL8_9PEZI|nr:NAD(P)-binding protein [Zopfia rhizophila CBS 207.26]
MAFEQNGMRSETYPFIEPSKFSGSLQGQVVLITGAGRGLGRASALAFARAGASVACLSRTESELHEVVTEIQDVHRGKAMAIVADVCGPRSPTSIVEEVTRGLGPVDILINNAAIDRINSFEHETDMNAWWRVFEVNFRAPINFTHAVLPGMLSRQRGVIISVGSRNAAINVPYMTAYSASKTALVRFHHNLELEVQGRGVYNYVVQPGDMPTTFAHEMLEASIGTCTEPPGLAANVLVMLTAEPDAKLLSGKYINVEENLEEIFSDAKKLEDSRISTENLYILKIDQLSSY